MSYHVTRDGERWHVVTSGRTVSRHNTKKPAIAEARRLARRAGEDYVIHDKYGLILERVSPD